MIILYHEKEPQGRAFDKDSAEQALRVGWYEEKQEETQDASEEREVKQDSEFECKGINELGQTTKAGGSNSPKRGRPVKKAKKV